MMTALMDFVYALPFSVTHVTVDSKYFLFDYRLGKTTRSEVGDVFIGYHEDALSCVILEAWKDFAQKGDVKVEEVC